VQRCSTCTCTPVVLEYHFKVLVLLLVFEGQVLVDICGKYFIFIFQYSSSTVIFDLSQSPKSSPVNYLSQSLSQSFFKSDNFQKSKPKLKLNDFYLKISKSYLFFANFTLTDF